MVTGSLLSAGIQCCYCEANLLNLALLREHMQSAHTKDQYYDRYSRKSRRQGQGGQNLSCKMDITDLKCKLCKQDFDLLTSLKEHLIKEHEVNFTPEGKSYIIEFRLSDGEVMPCALCSAPFETFKTLLQHMRIHYRNFICEECDMGFINKSQLNIHSRIHQTGTFECSFCPKVFTTLSRQMSHEKCVHKHPIRFKKCPLCEKTFSDYSVRNKHILEDHNSTAATYRCNICDKFYSIKKLLSKHIRRVHLMEKTHKCPECGYAAFEKKTLNDHMEGHKSEKIYKCTECNKAYARKKSLSEHMRLHKIDRRFMCEVCRLVFLHKCSLKGHMMSKHGLVLAEFEQATLTPMA